MFFLVLYVLMKFFFKNSGAMTHKTKDCLERPRRIGAKFNAKSGIAADEVIVRPPKKLIYHHTFLISTFFIYMCIHIN
jgi:hypothetical protein